MSEFRFKFAFRSLYRDKVYALLNVLGFSIGLGVSIIIFLYLRSELTYDQHFPDHEQVYRISTEITVNDNTVKYAGAGFGMVPLLEKEFDFIESGTRLLHIDENILFKREDVKLSDNRVAIADKDFFRVISLPLQDGDPVTALQEPQSIVISRSFSSKYFGSEDPMGKTISTNNYNYTVTGIFEDIPSNTHHNFSALISSFHQNETEEAMIESLWRIDAHSFLRLDDEVEAQKLIQQFPEFYKKYMAEAGKKLNGSFQLKLTPLEEVHYSSPLLFDRPSGSRGYLYAFGAIGLLILTLACINYVNMATIRGMKKAREAGMQKVLGSGRREIIYQVLIESFLLALVALLCSLVLVELVLELTSFNNILGKDLVLDFQRYTALWWLPLLLTILIALISGIYPALYLSQVSPLAGISRSNIRHSRGMLTRKLLVGFQFTISVAVVITALLMYQQMNFVKHKDLGFNKEDIVLVPLLDTVTIAHLPEITQRLNRSPYIMGSSTSHAIPGKTIDRTVIKVENEHESQQQVVDFMMVGLNYFSTMEIDLISGRDFTEADRGKEEYAVIINESAAKELGWKNPIGKTLEIVAPGKNENYPGRIIGMVRDFNAQSLHKKIEPALIALQEEGKGYLHVRIDSENINAALSEIETALAKVRPDNPFQFFFLNEDLMEMYDEEHRQSRLILFLTYLAIFISFLGLTGLASFTTNLRTREIGIRNVLGANLRQMLGLMFYEMLALVVVSVLLAIPLSYFLIRAWLQNFAFTTPLDPIVFVFSAIVAVLLAYLIISFHSVKVARNKPVNTLRVE